MAGLRVETLKTNRALTEQRIAAIESGAEIKVIVQATAPDNELVDETSGAAATVDALAEMGIVLAVDDFGTGYSSLLYLRRFPVHALKLDRSCVAGIGTSAVDTAIVGSMIDLARSLALVSIAEGVETVEQAEALPARGCDLAQGYFWSKAVPAGADAVRWRGRRAVGALPGVAWDN